VVPWLGTNESGGDGRGMYRVVFVGAYRKVDCCLSGDDGGSLGKTVGRVYMFRQTGWFHSVSRRFLNT